MREKLGWIAASCFVLIACLSLYWMLNHGYGETSEQGYAYAMALFSACNQKDVAKLDEIADLIAGDLEAGKLGEHESQWLNGIIDKGRQGNWKSASSDIRQLMNDQVQEVER